MLPALPLGDQPPLAQQAAGPGGEAREEEILVEAPIADPLRRGEAVALLDPALGTEILQIDPAGGRGLPGHGMGEGGGQLAGERLYDHPGRDHGWRQAGAPVLDIDTLLPLAVQLGIQPGADAGEAGQIVHPEPYLTLSLLLQLAGEPPGDADVAEVVHDAAEDIPVEGGQRERRRGRHGRVTGYAEEIKKPVCRVAHRWTGF
ncbi:hypothetical protein D3C85_936950 [compost metagenome]